MSEPESVPRSPSSILGEDDAEILTEWRDTSLQTVLSYAVGVGGASFAVTLWQVLQSHMPASYLGYILLCLSVLLTGRLIPRRHSAGRLAMLLLALYSAGAVGSLGGLVSLYGVGFLGMIVCAALFAGKRGLLIALCVTLVHTAVVAIAYDQHWIRSMLPVAGQDPHAIKNWGRSFVFLFGVASGLGYCVVTLIARLRANLERSVDLLRQLETEQAERLSVEGRLRKTERLEALGRLAGGIAHDFNNTLTVVVGEADYIASEVGSNHPLGESAEMIREAAELGSTLTRRLLLIGRSQDFLHPEPIDLPAALNDFTRIARRVLPESIEIVTEPGEPVVVEVDEAALHQTLLNLAINAGDAMDQQGMMRMSCSIREIGADEVLPAGRYAAISVDDIGSGIASEVIDDIFDPFFTTKDGVKGAGLGLASVYGFAKGSGGAVDVESKVGEGTTFTLMLPLSNKSAHTSSASHSAITRIGEGKLALVAEDNLRVRAILWTALSDAGYQVLEAPDGETALQLAQTSEAPISVLVTDLMMPGMDGATLAEKCNDHSPGLAILVVTGYAASSVMEKVRAMPNAALLRKPFGRRELLSELQKLNG